jgi:hypothetical protein
MAFLDDDLVQTRRDTLVKDVYKTASCKYSKLLSSSGNGQFPEEQRKRLSAFVNSAHKFGKKVRLWASPENRIVWKVLLSCGVDLINTDKLAELRDFLLSENSVNNKSTDQNLDAHF